MRQQTSPRTDQGRKSLITDLSQARLNNHRTLSAIGFELIRLQIKYMETKYRAEQQRAPAGTPIGGQWVRDGGFITPSTLLSSLDQWSKTDQNGSIAYQVAAADIPNLAAMVAEWLGHGAFQQNSPNGARQFFSADKSRHIRFDITASTSHGRRPHINVFPPPPGHDGHIFLR